MKRILFSLALIAVIFISCDKEENGYTVENISSELVINTGLNKMSGLLRSGPVSDFTEGSKLGLFITKGNLGEDYSSDVSYNIPSTMTNGRWIQTPAVNLYAHDAVIYAYYPYKSGSPNGKAMSVQSGLTDYMYGTHTSGQSAINKDNRSVNLTMNHALALIQFNLYKTDYSWAGRLTRVAINNAPDKSIVHGSGKMNIETGEITELSGSDRTIQINSTPLMVIPDIKSTDEKDYIKLLLIPTGQTTDQGDVTVHFSIDNREYTWKFPVGTQWKQGTKYTYNVQLNGNELSIGDVKIADWTDGVNGDILLE